jgi:hypothetical protein
MGKFTGYLIVSDLDGTLLNEEHQVSEKNAEAIRYFIENGGRFTVATGRIREEIEPFLDELIMNVPAIVSNGGMIYDFNSDFMIMERFLPHQIESFAGHVMKEFPQSGVMAVAKGQIFMVRENEIFRRDPDLYRTNTLPRRQLSELGESWAKVLFSVETEELPQLEAYLREQTSKVEIVQSYETTLELLPKGVSKGEALEFVIRGLRMDPEKVFVLGDNMNDYAMLQTVTNGWCVENANPRLKEIAARVMPPHTESAVAAMIEAVEEIVDAGVKADQELAVSYLKENDCTLAFVRDGEVLFESRKKGIRPMYEALLSDVDLTGAVLADRVIGRAAAILALSAGIRSLYTFVISESALAVCKEEKFSAFAYEEVSPFVMNRTRDDLCPIEKLSQGTDDPEMLMNRIEEFLRS